MDNLNDKVLFSGEMNAVLPDDKKNTGGRKYTLNVYKDKFDFSYKEGFLLDTIANQFGLLGMLLKKIFDKGSKNELKFSVDLSLVRKVVLNRKTIMGRKIQFLLFTGENYSNILNLTVNDNQLVELKNVLSDLFGRVEYEENDL